MNIGLAGNTAELMRDASGAGGPAQPQQDRQKGEAPPGAKKSEGAPDERTPVEQMYRAKAMRPREGPSALQAADELLAEMGASLAELGW